MALMEDVILTDSIEIKTAPEKIFGFLVTKVIPNREIKYVPLSLT